MSTLCSSTPGLEIDRMIIVVVCFSLFFLPVSNSVYFEITRFAINDETNIALSGDALFSDGTIEFNQVNNYKYRVGQAIYADAVQIWDKKSGEVSDFTTHFTFVIDTQGSSEYGHGFAFFLAPAGFQIPPNSAAGYLGLFNSSNRDSPQNQIIVVEFDSYSNRWDPRPLSGHVGINRSSPRSANSTAWNASLHSGDYANASLSYHAATQMLSLSWRYGADNTSLESTSLTYQVDLTEAVPEWVTIGFSAATGERMERHILRYWEFNSSLNIEEKSEDISKKRKLVTGLTVPLGVLVVVGIIASAIICSRKRKCTEKSVGTVTSTSINEDLERGAGPKRFSYTQLTLATNNFSDNQKLGEGGFGCVYMGYLSREGMAVAVKKISQDSKQGKKEYITEVKIISSLRHRNLVQLIGWCHDQTQFLLVYEFMPNGSLDCHLFGKKITLGWDARYKIATGLASALLYLHEECEQCVLHRDIKTSNIMLDLGFNAKLGDFGLARFMDHELDIKTTGLAGTIGYMAPEYATIGKASKESDVYSFGVVALEIVCGQKATAKVDQHSDLRLVEWVWGLHGKGELLSGVDQMLNNEFNTKEVECLMMVGLWCAHHDRSQRPSIRQAIQVLKFESEIPNLPMKMPMHIFYAPPSSSEISSVGATMTNTSIDLIR